MKMIYGIRLQLWNELKRLHLVPQNVRNFDDYEVNYYSSSWPMIQTAILAGCYPGVGVAKDGSKMRKIRTCAQNNASFHPSSVLKRQIVDSSKRSEQVNRFSNNIEPKIEFLVYQELIKLEEGITLRMVTACIPLAVLILAGTLHMSKNVIDGFKLTDKQESLLKNNEFLIEIESSLAMQGKFEDLQLIMRLRFKLMFYFLEFLKNPTSRLSREHNDLLACLNYVLSIDHHRFGFQML
uniref:DEAD-box helicase OB fold domain-containing protein n=1 Tax=Acrobeloides nanus TaxID=290746 RepID=A0A914E412_9BILA